MARSLQNKKETNKVGKKTASKPIQKKKSLKKARDAAASTENATPSP